MVKPTVRTKSIGFRVSEEEYAQLERSARAVGATVGEWCRDVAVAHGHAPAATTGTAEVHALMAELVALRTILLNLLYRIAHENPPSEETMRQLIDQADAEKVELARDRLARAAELFSSVNPPSKKI